MKQIYSNFFKVLFIIYFISSPSFCSINNDDQNMEEGYTKYNHLIKQENNEITPLRSSDFNEFKEWITYSILTEPEVTGRQFSLKIIGIDCGLAGSAVFFNLGRDLAKKIVKNEVFADITGVISAFPIAILGSQLSSDIFTQFAATIPDSEKKILKEENYLNIFGHKLFQGIEISIAFISAAPITYLTHKYYYPATGYIAITLEVPTFISKAVADYWAIDTMGRMIFDTAKKAILTKKYKDKDHTIQFKYLNLIKQLERAEQQFDHLSDIEINSIYHALNTLSSDADLIKNLFYPSQNKEITDQLRSCSWGRWIAGGIGGTIGALSAACLIPLGEESMANFLLAIGITDPLAHKSLGWIAGLSSGSLMAYATKDSFEKFYDFFSSLPSYYKENYLLNKERCFIQTKQLGISIVSLVIAAYSAAPQTYLSWEYIGVNTPLEKLILGCAAVGPFAMDFWAIDNFFKNCLTSKGPKQNLLRVINILKEKIPLMNENLINNLYQEVFTKSDISIS